MLKKLQNISNEVLIDFFAKFLYYQMHINWILLKFGNFLIFFLRSSFRLFRLFWLSLLHLVCQIRENFCRRVTRRWNCTWVDNIVRIFRRTSLFLLGIEPQHSLTHRYKNNHSSSHSAINIFKKYLNISKILVKFIMPI